MKKLKPGDVVTLRKGYKEWTMFAGADREGTIQMINDDVRLVLTYIGKNHVGDLLFVSEQGIVSEFEVNVHIFVPIDRARTRAARRS